MRSLYSVLKLNLTFKQSSVLDQPSANVFCKGSDSEYFDFGRPAVPDATTQLGRFRAQTAGKGTGMAVFNEA